MKKTITLVYSNIIMILVAVYDDHKDRRESLRLLLDGEPDMQCIGTYESCLRIVNDLSEILPDVVLMDIGMPDVDGITATQLIRKHYPAIKILMQTVFEDENRIFESILAGASGYILKKQSASFLLQAIREVHTGGAAMTPSVAKSVLDAFTRLQKAGPITEFHLSDREKQILGCLVKGMSYKMIADDCKISFYTVNSHVKNIYEKLHVHSASAAVAMALQQKLI